MSGYKVEGSQYIRAAGDDVNDAVNQWSGSAIEIYNGWLPYNALSEVGEPARFRYEEVREDALEKVHQATNALIEVRETLYAVAGGYKRTEKANEDGMRNIRPEINDPRYG